MLRRSLRVKAVAFVTFCVAAIAAMFAANQAIAEEVSFAGKRINVIIGTEAGGGTDGTSRLVGRYMQKYLPGQPQMVFRNMPAGNGAPAVNYFANETARDGTAWMAGDNGYIGPTTLRDSIVKYDPRQFNYIGGIMRGGNVLIMNKDKQANLTDKSKPAVVVGTPTNHTSGQSWGSRSNISNYTFNHVGAFAAAGEAFCKALLLGGVVHRFPELRFGFLEGGVNWAVSLYNDLVEHWEKRNRHALAENLDPSQIDRVLLAELVAQYGGERYACFLDRFKVEDNSPGARPGLGADRECIDDWALSGIESEQDIYDQFVPNFFFGCEADDRTLAHAFNTKCNHGGAQLRAVFSSDVAHWDVPDMTETLAEAYELVEEGLLTTDNFRDFTFNNAVRMQGLNPDFFKGTVIEAEAAKVLANDAAAAKKERP